MIRSIVLNSLRYNHNSKNRIIVSPIYRKFCTNYTKTVLIVDKIHMNFSKEKISSTIDIPINAKYEEELITTIKKFINNDYTDSIQLKFTIKKIPLDLALARLLSFAGVNEAKTYKISLDKLRTFIDKHSKISQDFNLDMIQFEEVEINLKKYYLWGLNMSRHLLNEAIEDFLRLTEISDTPDNRKELINLCDLKIVKNESIEDFLRLLDTPNNRKELI